MEKLLSTFEVSEILGISRETLQKARTCRSPSYRKFMEKNNDNYNDIISRKCDGEHLDTIPFCRIGSRVFYFQEDISKYIENIKKR